MVRCQGELGRLEALGREIEGPKGKGSCQSVRCGRRGSRVLVAANACRRGLSHRDACLSILGGLPAQLQGIGESFFMCPNEMC